LSSLLHIALTNPSPSPSASAFPLAPNRNLLFLYGIPFSLASSSVIPTVAISGNVNIQFGIEGLWISLFNNIFSTTCTPW